MQDDCRGTRKLPILRREVIIGRDRCLKLNTGSAGLRLVGGCDACLVRLRRQGGRNSVRVEIDVHKEAQWMEMEEIVL